MHNSLLEQELFKSQLRHTNRLAALKLGLFGTTYPQINNNITEYDEEQKQLIDNACENIKKSLDNYERKGT